MTEVVSLRFVFTLIIGAVAAALVLLFVGSLGQMFPGNPVVAVLMGLAFLLIGMGALRAILKQPPPEAPGEPEDVGELDVFFVCSECGTELHVEKLGELQVPRHCGERMLVERRPRTAPR